MFKSPLPSCIGLVLLPHANGSALLAGQALKRCGNCGELIDRNCSLDHFKMKKKRDLSCSEDGRIFGSARFKELWITEKGEGIEFMPLPAQPSYYFLVYKEVLRFDSERRMCRSEGYCSECKQFSSFVGATPAYLKEPNLLKGNCAYRSDLEFGSGDEKTPLLIVGLEIALKLQKAKLSGWCAEKVLL